MELLLKNVRLADSDSPCDVALADGLIERIDTDIAPAGCETVDGEGRVLIPAFVEGHIHMDKAYVADRMPNRSGTLAEAIAVTGKLKPGFTRRDIKARAARALTAMLERGTTAIRAHSEFDPEQGFTGFETMLELREESRHLADIQITAFPQEGIFKAPGAAEMMEEAMRMGADVVGGVPYNDLDAKAHIDFVFALAQKYDKPIDLHQDFADDADALSIEYLCDKTLAEGYTGRVTVGHLTALGALEPERLQPLAEKIARAGISVMCLPATDMHLGGRGDTHKVRRGLTPVRQLRKAGVNVCLATNNIRNAFTPFGNGDLIQIALLAIPAAHLGGADELPGVLSMITGAPANALGLKNYGLSPGCRGDLVLLDTKEPRDAVIDVPQRLLVIRRGKILLQTSIHKIWNL